jgi:hypothetical protein
MTPDVAMGPTDAEKTVAYADAVLQSGWTKVPNDLIEHPSISPGAKLTWIGLALYAHQRDEAWPGQERLADVIGFSERSVRTYIGELQSVGLLDVLRRGLGMTNLYRLHVPVGAAAAAAQERHQLPGKKTKREEDQEKEDGARDVREVWDHYVALFNAKRMRLDVKRQRIIRNALKVRSVEECKRAIDGLRVSEHHNGGPGGNGPKYLDIRYALKGIGAESDDARIDKMISVADSYGPKPGTKDSERAERRFEKYRRFLARAEDDYLAERHLVSLTDDLAEMGYEPVIEDGTAVGVKLKAEAA